MTNHVNVSSLQQTSMHVSENMFGGNFLFNRNSLERYDEVNEIIPISGLRYPGGAIAERYFDITNPDAIPPDFDTLGQERFTSLSEFLSYCNETGCKPTIVLPTRVSLDGNREVDQQYIDDIKIFVRETMLRTSEDGEFSNVDVYAFELGNEYWGNDLSSIEYGQIANEMSKAVQEVLAEFALEQDAQPIIMVQMGNPVAGRLDYDPGGILYNLRPGTEESSSLGLTEDSFDESGELKWSVKINLANHAIIDQLDDTARVAIDGLVEHYYYGRANHELPEYFADSLQVRSIDMKLNVWRDAGFEHEGLHLTEWNIQGQNYDHLGMVGAGVKVAQMSYMIQLGAESAFSWPHQHNTPNDLAGSFDSHPELSAIGGAMSLMANYLPGTQFLENGFSHPDLSLFTYGSETETFGFLISRSEETIEANLDLSELIYDGATVHVTSLYVESDGLHWVPNRGRIEVEEYRDHDALAVFEDYEISYDAQTGMPFSLRPYELIFFRYEIAEAQAGRLITGTPGNDLLRGGIGDDTIRGYAGNDTIFGEAGDNNISGGDGHDLIYGGSGDDTISGGSGNDTIHGGGGSNFLNGGRGNDLIRAGDEGDLIWGGGGNDVIHGGAGGDTIWGGNGNDKIYGGDGNDSIGGGAGDDFIRGGAGDDIIWGGEGDDTIHGDEGNDTIYGGAGNDLIYGGLGDDLIYGGRGDDVIFAGAGNDTLYGGAGADTFKFSGAEDINMIMDFDVGGGDRIGLHKSMLAREDRNLSSSEIAEKFGYLADDGSFNLWIAESKIIIKDYDEDEGVGDSIFVFG